MLSSLSFACRWTLRSTAAAALIALFVLPLSACQTKTEGSSSKPSDSLATSQLPQTPPPTPEASDSSAANDRELALTEGSSLDVSQVPTDTQAPNAQASIEEQRLRRIAEAERVLAARARTLALREARLAERSAGASKPSESLEAATPVAQPLGATPSEIADSASEAEMVPDLAPLNRETPSPTEAERSALPSAPPAEIPAGTEVSAELLSDLSSESSVAGQAFRTKIAADVEVDGEIAIPAGSEVHGYVVEARAARPKEAALLELRVTDLVLPTGETYPLSATLLRRGKSDAGRDAATVGGAAAGGAILGRAAAGKGGRGKGALVGAILGAVVGAVIASRTPGEEVLIPRGEVLDIRLDRALSIGDRPAHP